MVAAPINHIGIDDRGRAMISGTSTKVTDIVIDTYTWNLTPEQIRDNHPDLTLAEIHSALAYYHDHREEIDPQIAESDREYKAIKRPNPLTRAELEKRLNPSG